MSQTKTVMLAGATGLVGSFALSFLNEREDVSSIILPVRKQPASAPEGKKLHWIDINGRPPAEWFPDQTVDAVLCAVGTTMKKAGNRKAFCDVDYKIPIELAKEAKRRGVSHFAVVSAKGAHPGSFFFYNRVKGEMEAGLKRLELPRLSILRPGLLLGPRKEHRAGEKAAENFFSAFGAFLPSSWKPNQAEAVAKRLVREGLEGNTSIAILTSRDLQGA